MHGDPLTSADVPLAEHGAERGGEPQPRELADFTERCRFQETDPGSHFSTTRRAVLAVDGGRISLRDGTFSETGQPDREVGTREEYALLEERFGITLKSEWVLYTPVRPA